MFASNMAFFLALRWRAARSRPSQPPAHPAAAQVLPKLASGEWMGTMKPHRVTGGLDLGLMRTGAVPQGDHYRLLRPEDLHHLRDHDLTDNIIHLVLARTRCPYGVKGISLFCVPKFMINAMVPMATATMCAAFRSSTSWAFMAARPV